MWSARHLAAILGLAALLVGTATCNLVAGLGDYEFKDGAGGAGVPCATTDDCNDQNRCTEDACSPQGCVFTSVANGKSPVQIDGDCQVIQCKGGVESAANDDGDLHDDDNDCTADTCQAGTPHNTPKPDGESCTLAGSPGTCANGACLVACGPGLPPCDDQQPCTTDSCDDAKGSCVFAPLADGTKTPSSVDVPGDCQGHVCQSGKDVLSNDDADHPITATDCDQELCVDGKPKTPPLGVDAPCFTGGGSVCDGNGACVACNADQKCPGTTDDCQHPGCVEHACVTLFPPNGTVVSPALQVPGDCKVKVCDGNGAIIAIPDSTDAMDDGNPCTDDVCVGGMISHPFTLAGVMCGVGLVCSGMGDCVDCASNADCMAPATCGGCGVANTCCCKPKTCAELGQTCGMAANGCGGQIQCNDAVKNGSETDVDCGGASCPTKCGNAKACSAGADCVSGSCADGVCCDVACNGTCQACNLVNKVGMCSPIVAGVDNSPANTCNGANTCVNGACKKTAGQACAVAGDCASNFCADGVCCNSTCNGVCKSCAQAGSVGTCTNVASGQQDPVANNPCINLNACDGAGVCKKANGQPCALGNECASVLCVDTVCCGSACNGTCQSCNVSGSAGLCANIPQYTNDTSPGCAMSNTCDGAGACLKINGAACAAASDCASHKCQANVCVP